MEFMMPCGIRESVGQMRRVLPLLVFSLGINASCADIFATTTNPDDQESLSPPVGPPSANGLQLWNNRCESCHGSFSPGSIISSGNPNGDFRLDLELALSRHGSDLEAYIDRAMPVTAPDSCVGDCGLATGQYLRSLYQPPIAVTCTEDAGQAYGVRELKLLTSHEYQKSLQDLLNINVDYGVRVANNNGYKGGFINMDGKALSGTSLDAYVRNAESIAEWAVQNGLPWTCSNPTDCGQRFVDEFLFLAFRGEVSETQKSAYKSLFTAYPNEGMKLALESALTSPYFLYRIEAGVDLQTAKNRGYYSSPSPGNQTPNEGELIPVGQPTDTLLGTNFPPGSPGRLDGQDWALLENGQIRFAFQSSLSNPSIIEIEARGSPHGNIWPELTVRVGDSVVGVQTVNTPQLSLYRFEVHGVSQIEWVQLEFHNDSGVPPYSQGQDVNLYIARANLYAGDAVSTGNEPVEPEPSPPDPADNLLDGVDPNAFVLSPYELATTLSFMLTGSTPDLQLLEAARNGQLSSRRQIQSHVERLIDSPKGHEHFGDFVTEWFELQKINQVTRPDIPEFTDEVKAAMLEEVRRHFEHVFYDPSVPFSEFYGGQYSFLNQTLAQFYDVSGNFTEAFVQTEVSRRGGPLASGAFMAINAHVERTAPILRAVHAREAALCHYIDPPNSPIAGENIDEQRAAAQMRVAEREQQEGILSSRDFYFLFTDGIDACAGCHEKIINPMFGMEDFDNAGRLRAQAGAEAVLENLNGEQVAVPISGTLFGVSSTSDPTRIDYTGAKDFSNKIAQTEAVDACLTRKAFRFMTGLTYVDRDLDTAQQETLSAEQRASYSCLASRMLDAFDQNNKSPRAMAIELATDSLLMLRR